MLDLQRIENTIKELEDEETTFDTCIKLSALYVVREHLGGEILEVEDEVVKELSDILPHYEMYVQAKRNFQLTRTEYDAVLDCMKIACKEISEFIYSIYSSTDNESERILLYEMLNNILQKIRI